MSTTQSTRTEAIVLRRTNYGEADRIVQFLTPGGKVSALARGARKQKSKLAGGIELLATTDITLHSGRSDLAILTSARLKTFFAHILTDYDRLQFAYYVLKDIARVTEHIQEPEFYTVLEATFASLDNPAITLPTIELWYRLQLANLLGVGANLARDNRGGKLTLEGRYRFDVADMAFSPHPGGEYTSDHIKLLRIAQTTTPAIVAQVASIADLLSLCLAVARAAHE